tara:strand:- start:375 stop:755 length:381 start_codon:yes stop_codon:yes gene_type:complete
MQVKEIIFDPSTIETIDMGLYNWADNTLALHTTTNEGWKKVPVIWLGSERAFQVKKDELLRDGDDRLKLPIISVTRESITKTQLSRVDFKLIIPKKTTTKAVQLQSHEEYSKRKQETLLMLILRDY